MGRILGIDLGAKRTGLAQTDSLQISLNPLPTINTEDLAVELSKRLMIGDISHVVFGMPYHADGTPTLIGENVKKWIQKLRSEYPDVSFSSVDESFSSRESLNVLITLGTSKKKRREKSAIDQMSAVLILKKYLESL